jgi:hypothetical protein
MLRKLAFAAAAATALGYAALTATPAQAAGAHIGLALTSPAIESPVVKVVCVHRFVWSGLRCWHTRRESRRHSVWRSRRWR